MTTENVTQIDPRTTRLQHLDMEIVSLDQAVKMLMQPPLQVPLKMRVERCERLMAGLLAARKVDLMVERARLARETEVKPLLNPEAEMRA